MNKVQIRQEQYNQTVLVMLARGQAECRVVLSLSPLLLLSSAASLFVSYHLFDTQ